MATNTGSTFRQVFAKRQAKKAYRSEKQAYNTPLLRLCE